MQELRSSEFSQVEEVASCPRAAHKCICLPILLSSPRLFLSLVLKVSAFPGIWQLLPLLHLEVVLVPLLEMVAAPAGSPPSLHPGLAGCAHPLFYTWLSKAATRSGACPFID